MSLEKCGELKGWTVFLVLLNAEDGNQVYDKSPKDRFIGRKWALPWSIGGEMIWKAEGYNGKEDVGEDHGEGTEEQD